MSPALGAEYILYKYYVKTKMPQMNYQKIYFNLIDRARNRELSEYKEIHHVVPRCLGGSDMADNLVSLTPEEHYVAHQLLTRIYPNEHKLVYAAIAMIRGRSSNKMHGWLRRRFSKVVSDRQQGSGNSQFGLIWISNPDTKVSKKCSPNEIPDGWIKGRNKWEILKNKICKVCGNKFVTYKQKASFCSVECKQEHMNGVFNERRYKNGYVVEVDGVSYTTISKAADCLGIGHETARMRFKSSNFPNWIIASLLPL
jgi:hypothetical protein